MTTETQRRPATDRGAAMSSGSDLPMVVEDAAWHAERDIVGACLAERPVSGRDSRWLAEVRSSGLRGSDFDSTVLGQLFELFADARHQGQCLDLTTAVDLVERSGLRGVTRVDLARLLGAHAAPELAGQYARIIREAADRRRLVAAGTRLVQLATDRTLLVGEVVQVVRAELDVVSGVTG